MVPSADIVIIGGGVIGASAAHHLSKRGAGVIAVIEKDALGAGSTGRCAGGIRQQFSTPVNVRLSIASVQAFERFEQEMEYPISYRQWGYLFLYPTEELWARAQVNHAMQRALGLDVELVSPQRAMDLTPGLNVDRVLGCSYCPTDGFAEPASVVQGYVQQAKRHDVHFYQGTRVTGIRLEHGRIRAVETSAGDIATDVVVNAAGPHAGVIGEMVGMDIPIKPYRRHIFVTDPTPAVPDHLPLTVDMETSLYFHKELEAVLLGMSDRDEPSTFDTQVSWAFLDKVVEQAIYRLPILGNAGIQTGWAGLYEVTPDHHPIIGWVPGDARMVCAAGFSGHGFMHAPIAGQLVAELILDGKASSVDIAPLRLERFAENAVIEETAVI